MSPGIIFKPEHRNYWQAAFFTLFLVAPILNVFRLDLYEGHFYFLTMDWSLDLQSVLNDNEAPFAVAQRVFLRVLFPVVSFIVIVGWLVWKYGRIYCGWLCPHFSVVEMVNKSLRRSLGKLSVWDKEPLPIKQQDGTEIQPTKKWLPVTVFVVLFFSGLWSITLLTYLLPPKVIWVNLLNMELTRNQALFIGIGTFLFSIEFAFARHLFCRFGCAIGVFQSLIWMGNNHSMVVGFDRKNAKYCSDCDASCEHACPMRIKPRQIKRLKFTCTQCQSCVTACSTIQNSQGRASLLQMVEDDCALGESQRGFGRRPKVAIECFNQQDQKKDKGL